MFTSVLYTIVCIEASEGSFFRFLPRSSVSHLRCEGVASPFRPGQKTHNKKALEFNSSAFFMVSLERFERPTHALEGRCSIQLSYRPMTCQKTRYIITSEFCFVNHFLKNYLLNLVLYLPTLKDLLILRFLASFLL